MLGTNTSPINFGDAGTFPAGTFYQVFWQFGITEPGSSGSGLFTYDPSVSSFVTRGTLTGGNDACSNPISDTYYSPLYSVYPNISGLLTVPVAPPHPRHPISISTDSQGPGTSRRPVDRDSRSRSIPICRLERVSPRSAGSPSIPPPASPTTSAGTRSAARLQADNPMRR
jgi:hypothetical protein